MLWAHSICYRQNEDDANYSMLTLAYLVNMLAELVYCVVNLSMTTSFCMILVMHLSKQSSR